jgi:hypothetical protein
MDKLFVSIALAAMSLAAHAQNMDAPAKPDLATRSAVLRFVGHPDYCKHLLSGGHGTALLPNNYSAALDASLNELNGPVSRARAQIKVFCALRSAHSV